MVDSNDIIELDDDGQVVEAKPLISSRKKNDLVVRGSWRGQPSLWDFWKDGVTSSFLNSYLACQEQTRLHYVEGWQSRKVPIYFEFGTCCHWVLEQLYGKKKLVPPTEQEIKKLVEKYHHVWLKQVDAPSRAQLEQQEQIYGMAEPLLLGYSRRWNGDFNGGKYQYTSSAAKPARWDSLEEIFCIPYVFPDGKKTVIRGRRDGVFSTAKGEIFVFDTKCRSMIKEDEQMDTLPFDLQQMLYLWVTCEQRRLRKQNPIFPSGVVMNILRRPGQRWLVKDNLQSYCSRVAKDVLDPKRFDHYYVRYQMRLTKGEILEWKKSQLDPIMMDVRLWVESKRPHYMNHNALVSKYGRCQMYDGIIKNDFSQCYRRSVPFNELADL